MQVVISGERRWRPIRHVLLAATILTPVAVTSAQAADATISTSTTTAVNLNQLLPNGGTVDILAGVNISPGFFASATAGTAYTVSNGGTLNNAQGGAPGFLGAGGTINNLNGGTITNTNGANGRSVLMFGGGAGNMTFINSGTARGEVRLTQLIDNVNQSASGTVGTAGAISLTNQITGVIEGDIDLSGGTSNTVTNAGRITGHVQLGQDSPNSGAPTVNDSIVRATTKTLTNTSTGVITDGVLVGGGFVRNLTFNGQLASYDVFTQGTVTNAGTIMGPVGADTVTNTGTITAKTGNTEIANIAVISYGNASQTTYASLSGTLTNSGTITGDVSVRTIVNSGTINGNLLYGTDTGFDISEDEGAILGGLQSLRGAAVSTSLTNSGSINGRITMANGTVSNTGTLALGSTVATSNVGGNFTQSSAGTWSSRSMTRAKATSWR